MMKEKSCTIRDLANHLGLSTCTVSKVLNSNGELLSISPETQRKVREAAVELNYVPNIHAQRFFKGRSMVIGLMVPPQDEMGNSAFKDTHFTEIISGIEQALTGSHYNLLLLFNRPEYREGNRYQAMFQSGLLDGLLIWGAHRSDDNWRELLELDGPRIFLTSMPDANEGDVLNYVCSDYDQAGFEIVNALKARKCRNFAWLAGKENTSIVPQLEIGIRRAGLAVAPEKIRFSDYTETDGEHLTLELLRRFPDLDAILTTAPQLARGAQRAVGDRVQIGCFDGQTSTRQPGDRYLAVATDDFAIGYQATQSLIKLINDNSIMIQQKIPVLINQ